MKVLILGGYGVFGGKLAELLSDLPELELLICGRNLPSAEAFCTAYEGRATVRPLKLDRKDIAAALQSEQPEIVVDASGPFQAYGDNCYSVIEACIEAGVHYIDFADAADFVFGVSRFDAQARAAGVFVLSGISSCPVLTAAALREMGKAMDIVSVEGGIAPSPYAGIGLNVMRAVVSYAGARVKLWRGGQQAHGTGLAESRRFTIAVPGKIPLRNRRFSLVDVPDLQIIPPDYPAMTDIWMGAGTVPETLHRMLNLLAKARAHLGLPSLAPLSRLFHIVSNVIKFGEHRGGMFVRARGMSGGREVEQSWHLLAEGDAGPYIPSMASEAIIRKCLSGDVGEWPENGARAGTHVLELSDFEKSFQDKAIVTAFRREESEAPLYRQILGDAYETLPARLQLLHGTADARQWAGQAEVRRGSGIFAKLICAIMRFPKTAPNVPVTVTFTPEAGGERWVRNFDGRIFSSLQRPGTGKNAYLLAERFGLIDIALALVIQGDRLFLVPRSWQCLGIPLPKFLLPKGQSFETERDGQFCFDVEIAAPIIGVIVGYKGTLEPVRIKE